MKRILLAALVPVVASLAGCSAFNVEAEQPQACLTVPPQTFDIPVAPGTVGPFHGSFSGQVDLGITAALPSVVFSGSPDTHILRFLGLDASITPASGVANFNFLQNASLSVTNGVTTEQLAFYGGGLPAGTRVLSLGPLNAVNNLVGFLTNGNMVLYLDGTVDVPAGTPVPTSFTASVTACFSAKVKKTFQELIDGK